MKALKINKNNRNFNKYCSKLFFLSKIQKRVYHKSTMTQSNLLKNLNISLKGEFRLNINVFENPKCFFFSFNLSILFLTPKNYKWMGNLSLGKYRELYTFAHKRLFYYLTGCLTCTTRSVNLPGFLPLLFVQSKIFHRTSLTFVFSLEWLKPP